MGRLNGRTSRGVFLTMGVEGRKRGIKRCTVVRLPMTRTKHFVHLPSGSNGGCLVCLSSIMHCYLPLVFRNVGCGRFRTCTFGFAGSTRVRVSGSLHGKVVRGVSGKMGDHGQNRPLQIVCSTDVPGSLLGHIVGGLGLSGLSAMLNNKGCRGRGSLVHFPSYNQGSLGCPR